MARTGLAGTLLLGVSMAACSNDAGVVTERADVVVTTTPERDLPTLPTSPPVMSPVDVDLEPRFPVPIPDTDSATTDATAPAVDERTASTGPATSVAASVPHADADLATAGDSLYQDVGNGDLDVTEYVVRIEYDPADAEIIGHLTVTATATAAVEQLVLDAVGLNIEAVDVDGATTTFTTTDDELVIDHPAPAGAVVDVDVRYRSSPASHTSSYFAPIGWFATETGSYVLNEPDALRSWMPADDHPGDKATWRFELTVPDGLAAIANGEQQPSVDAGASTTWIWVQRDPMSTYLVQLLIGEYTVIDGGEVSGVPIVNVALTDDVEQMTPYFDTVAPQLEYFESVFGPYPLDRYGLAFTESYGGLAMETQGRSMFSAGDFPPTTPGNIGYFEDMFLSHELAHQWFGNAVSPADWADIWLNESFASYGTWLWFDHTGREPIETVAAAALADRQFSIDATGSPSVDTMFGHERYDGGAVVLHALRMEVGDDDFFTILQRWVSDYDGTSRTSADFIALSEGVSGRSLADLFDAWLYSTDLPAEYPS